MTSVPRSPSPWPRNAVFGPDGLILAACPAPSLADAFGTPLIVVDEEDFRERCRAFRRAFGEVLWAVKAFPARSLMRIALEEGLGLLASTGGELRACLDAGAPPERLMLHGNNKSDEEIGAAVQAGVGLLSVDNDEELDRVHEAARSRGVVQPVLLRVAPAIEAATHPFIRTGAEDTKFGIPAAGGLALAALRRAAELPGLALRGLHIHLGSQLLSPDPYLRAVDVAVGLLARAEVDGPGLLDLGGGFGVTYVDETPLDGPSLAPAIRDRLRARCGEARIAPPRLMVEPGRALVANAAVTLYRAGTPKVLPGIRTYVPVDGGMSDNIRPALYGARHRVALASRRSTSRATSVTVVGKHCESGDVLAADAELPDDLRRGDLLAVSATGAYTYALASNYNKVGRPAVVLARDGRARLVLRREEHDDLDRLEVTGPEVDVTGPEAAYS